MKFFTEITTSDGQVHSQEAPSEIAGAALGVMMSRDLRRKHQITSGRVYMVQEQPNFLVTTDLWHRVEHSPEHCNLPAWVEVSQ